MHRPPLYPVFHVLTDFGNARQPSRRYDCLLLCRPVQELQRWWAAVVSRPSTRAIEVMTEPAVLRTAEECASHALPVVPAARNRAFPYRVSAKPSQSFLQHQPSELTNIVGQICRA